MLSSSDGKTKEAIKLLRSRVVNNFISIIEMRPCISDVRRREGQWLERDAKTDALKELSANPYQTE